MNFIYKDQTPFIIKRCNHPFCGQKRLPLFTRNSKSQTISKRKYLGKIVAFCEKELVAIGDATDQPLKAAEKKSLQKAFYF
nr:conserved hypothetical protein [uncultured archaeon]